MATRKCLRGVGRRRPHEEGDDGLSVKGRLAREVGHVGEEGGRGSSR